MTIHKLHKEIALALAVKGALLFGLWFAFFSNAQNKAVTPDTVYDAVLARQISSPITNGEPR